MGKKTKNVKTEEKEKSEMFQWDFEPAQMDLLLDINDDFFAESNELIRWLAQTDKTFASKLKRYVDLIERLHGKFMSMVDDKNVMLTKIKFADEKLQLALETTATSEDMFEQLRVSLAEAWRESDAARQRNAMYSLQEQEISKGKEDRMANIISIEEEESTIYSRLRPAVFRERDRLQCELMEYEKRLEIGRFYCESLESTVAMYKDLIVKQQAAVRQLERELDTKVKKAEDTMEDQLKELQRIEALYQTTVVDLEILKSRFVQTTRELEALRLSNEQLAKENFSTAKKYTRVEKENKTFKGILTNLNEKLEFTTRKLTHCSLLNRQLQRDHKKSTVALMSTQHRLQVTSHKIGALNEIIQRAKHIETGLEKKLRTTLAQLEEMTLLKDEILRSRNKANYNIVDLNNTIAGIKHEVSMKQNEISNLNVELEKSNVKLHEKSVLAIKLGKDKDCLMSEVIGLSDKMKNLTEQLEIKVESITTLNEQLQIKHQDYLSVKQKMESIYSEKVQFRKSLELVSRDRTNTRNINIKLNHQINQLGHEININEKCITEQKVLIDHLSNDLNSKQSEIMNLERLLQMTRNELREEKMKATQAYNTISADEAQIIKMNIEKEEIYKQKNLVGVQLVRRNGEVALLQDRIRMMQTALDRGNIQYNQNLDDIRLLKLEIKNLSMSNECLTRASNSTANMRFEILRLERELTHERLRASALLEELQRPCRIHRWRLLRGNDPHKYDLIRKMQVLLKRNFRLILQNTNQGNKINEIQFMYDKLRDQLKLIPDPSIKQHLNEQLAINRKQACRIKSLKAEQSVNEIELKRRDCVILSYQKILKDMDSQKNLKNQLIDQLSFCTTPPCEPIVDVYLKNDSDQDKRKS